MGGGGGLITEDGLTANLANRANLFFRGLIAPGLMEGASRRDAETQSFFTNG